MNQQVVFFQILLIHDTYLIHLHFQRLSIFLEFLITIFIILFYEIFNFFIHKVFEWFKYNLFIKLPCKIHISFEKIIFYTEIWLLKLNCRFLFYFTSTSFIHEKTQQNIFRCQDQLIEIYGKDKVHLILHYYNCQF